MSTFQRSLGILLPRRLLLHRVLLGDDHDSDNDDYDDDDNEQDAAAPTVFGFLTCPLYIALVSQSLKLEANLYICLSDIFFLASLEDGSRHSG